MFPALACEFVPSRDPVGVPLRCKSRHLPAPAVVEEIGLVWVPERGASGQCRLDDLERLVVGGHEDVNTVAGRHKGPHGLRPTPAEKSEQPQRQEVVQLHQPKGVEGLGVDGPACIEEAPGEVDRSPAECAKRHGPQQDRMTLPPASPAALRCPRRPPVSGPFESEEGPVLGVFRTICAGHHQE